MMKTKIFGFPFLYAWAVVFLCLACGGGSDEPEPAPPTPSPKVTVMDDLWATSPFEAQSSARQTAFNTLQKYADECSSTVFKSYLSSTETVAASLENSVKIIDCYNQAFNRVLEGVKNANPTNGEAYIWMLYNMGYVVKTPSGAFGIDIFHRRGAELAPYLNFYGMTHTHQDHKCLPLADEMVKLNKPVLSNFYEGSSYTSTTAKDFTIGDFKVHTFITNHNNGSTNVPVTVFKVDCGVKGGNLVLMHSGDSNFLPEQYQSVKNADIDVFIPRYAPNALTENDVIGSVFQPKYVLLSHILELTHDDPSTSRWTLSQGLERTSKLNCNHSYMPFWGERMVWKNYQLSQ